MSGHRWFRGREPASSRMSGLVLILGGLSVAVYAMWSAEGGTTREATGFVQTAQSFLVARPTEAAPVPVVVTLAARSSEPSAPRLVAPPKDREALTRELQKELRRAGCYEGEVNGVWTPATRRAMKAFTDRVNAALPVGEPDAILYAMVQGQPDQVCSQPCLSAEKLSEDGRCLPSAILAKATARKTAATAAAAVFKAAPEKPATAITGWSTTTTAVVPPPALPIAQPDGRMALAGPALEPEARGEPPAATAPARHQGQAGARRSRGASEARMARPAPQRGTYARMVFRPSISSF